MNFQVTPTAVNVRLGSWIVFYCIEPHCLGWRRYWPEYWGVPPEKVVYF